MNRWFSIDSGFYKFMTKVADFMILAFFTLLCSLPLITIGPALTALFYVTLKLVKNEEGYVARSYFTAFKKNFVQSLVAELIVVAAGLLLAVVMNISYEWAVAEGSLLPRLIYFLQLGAGIVLIAGFIYLFPLIARFDNKVLATCKNAILMSVRHIPQTLSMLVVDGLCILYTAQYPALWFFDVAIISFANSYVLARVFQIYMPRQQEEGEADEAPEGEGEEAVQEGGKAQENEGENG